MNGRLTLACTLLGCLSLFPAKLLGVGMPIIDGVKAELSMKEIVQKAVRVVRDEALARIDAETSIKISDERSSSDENLAANTVNRITSAIKTASNSRADAGSAPYMDACDIVSVARATTA